MHQASGAMGAVAVFSAGWPLIDQMNPSKDVEALSKIEVDLTGIEEGKSKTVMWRGKPLFIKHRTVEEINEAQKVDISDLPHPEKDNDRVKNPKFLVLIGVCTHLGCVPASDKGEYKGWFCPCHGSHYDTSGRIRKGPAPTNLEIPPYEFTNENTILVG
ncbi:ubiquinol-cytochrome c reductase iron-sulfur subunit [Alphaproteobacteria bacterium]|nr:ubiquinol-cytochrome c reductase iron-sulfur subunit [Alphaproteobacteria bacterium]